jgi:asparagine synthase (glutamine-hydrolysing)
MEVVLSTLKARLEDRRLSPVARAVRERRLTYLRVERLRALERCASRVNRKRVAGDFLEAGLALGGSAIVLAASMGSGRRFHGYDVFGMIPPPSERDPPEVHERYATIASGRSQGIRGDTYYGYRDDLYEHVTRTFAAFGMPVGDRVQLYKGLFEETLHPDGPIALAHIDSDWFDPVDLCLRRIAPHLSPGGAMVLDDYDDYGGCRAAADGFLAEHDEFALMRLGSNVAVVRR